MASIELPEYREYDREDIIVPVSERSSTGLLECQSPDSSSPYKCAVCGSEKTEHEHLPDGAGQIKRSRWYRGYGTISLTVFFYLLAVGIVVGNICLFRYLDGKPAANYDENIQTTLCLFKKCKTAPFTSQKYVTTSSVIMANAFYLCLQAALAQSFAQYLWKVLRTRPIKVKTVEVLFNIRSNPLCLFHASAFKDGLVLVLIALFMYLLPASSSFPPGGLTVKSISTPVSGLATVPTFNVSDTGNGTLADLKAIAFSNLDSGAGTINGNEWNGTLWTDFIFAPGGLQRLAATTSLSGKPVPIPSPCGSNCSYSIEFEGPSMKCSETMQNLTKITSFSTFEQDYYPIYYSKWYYFDPAVVYDDQFDQNVDDSQPITMNFSVLTIPQIPYTSSDFNNGTSFIMTETKLVCVPYRSLYKVTNSYNNSIQTLNYSITPVELLPHVEAYSKRINISGTNTPGLTVAADQSNLGGIEWTEESRAWFRDSQLMGLVTGMATALNGTVSTEQEVNGLSGTSYLFWSSADLKATGQGGPLIQFSRFASSFHDYTFPVQEVTDPPVNFTVTEALLNQALGDYVVSLIPAFGAWNQTVNVTRWPSTNVYSFSSPLDVYIPYGVCLLIGLIIIALGMHALHENGVPAADGGFIQILSTTTGSAKLRKAAAANCLGGDKNLPNDFTNMKIQYGELVNMAREVDGMVVRRAGFGVEDEVMPLVKGEHYGVVH